MPTPLSVLALARRHAQAPGGSPAAPGPSAEADWWERIYPRLPQVPVPHLYPESAWMPRTPDYDIRGRVYDPADIANAMQLLRKGPPIQDESGEQTAPPVGFADTGFAEFLRSTRGAGYADGGAPPLSYAPSEYTTDPEMRQERVSQALGWDTSRPWRELGRRALTQLPLALGRVPVGPHYLSRNMATYPGDLDYLIMRGGFPLGRAQGFLSSQGGSPPTAYIGTIGSAGGYGPNSLGPSAMRQLIGAFRRDFPDVDTFTGLRNSGARRNAANPEQVVRMPRDQLELPLGPGRAVMPSMRAPVPLRPRSGEPTQGQRDLYELTPATNPNEARAMMSDPLHRSMNDPVRSQRFWDAPPLHEARPSSVPPSNAPQRGPTQAQREFNALSPYALEDATMSPPGPSYYDPVRVRTFNNAIRDFETAAPPPFRERHADGGAVDPPRPLSFPTSEFTTPRELAAERVSQAFGRDVEEPYWLQFARRAITQLPLATRSAVGARIGSDHVWASQTPSAITYPELGASMARRYPSAFRDRARPPFAEQPQLPPSNNNRPFLRRYEAPVDPYDFAAAWQQAMRRKGVPANDRASGGAVSMPPPRHRAPSQ